MQTEKIILGIDPGTAVMGFGIISIFKNKIKLLAIDELVMKKEPTHEIKLKKFLIELWL
jgi:crossover junction endodeoxyribonuclease RuvC